MTETFWNGLPAPARRGTAVVADAPEFPRYWARDLVGTRIEVVEVEHDGDMMYLGNSNNGGWWKVTEGKGLPRFQHANVSIEPGSFDPLPERTGLMSRASIEDALLGWSAARAVTQAQQGAGEHFDDPYQRGLAEGYASALEMVLRGDPQ